MLKNTLRILTNIDILLRAGTFPGEQAEAVLEARQFVARMAADIQKDIAANDEQSKEAGSGDRNPEDAGRVVASRVPDKGRKGRKRKGIDA